MIVVFRVLTLFRVQLQRGRTNSLLLYPVVADMVPIDMVPIDKAKN